MPHAVLFLLMATAGALIFIKERGRVHVNPGESVRFVFEDGSNAEHMGRLRLLFTNVVDEGNGSYLVTSSTEGNIPIPSGARVAGESIGATSIQLYAGYYQGQHIGFALGAGAANAIHRAYPSVTFKLSAQKYPQKWSAQWLPVWGDYAKRTLWGRFLSPYDGVIANYMNGNGFVAFNEPDPRWKTTAEWERLALR